MNSHLHTTFDLLAFMQNTNAKFVKENYPDPNVNYPTRYDNIASHLEKEIHPHIVTACLEEDGAWLTDHGVKHIREVISKSEMLLSNCTSKLNGYEAYLLLMAIQFHDVGNKFGRNNHEKKISKIIYTAPIDSYFEGDSAEQRLIISIAQAHGGTIEGTPDGNKDTISELPFKTSIDKVTIRPQLLAALLRLSDELADSSRRVSKQFLENHKDTLNSHSTIFHKYAERLNNLSVESNTILVEFELALADIDTEYAIPNSNGTIIKTKLLEYIYSRLLKLHKERLYCNQYHCALLIIKDIKVKIEIYRSDANAKYSILNDLLSFNIGGYGYPDSVKDLSVVCPEISGKSSQYYITRLGKQHG